MTEAHPRPMARAASIEQLADRIERAATGWENALEDLASAARAFAERPDVAPEARLHVLASLERFAESIDAPPIEGVAAAGAGDGRVAVDLDLVGRLAAALRAGDVEYCDTLLHDTASVIGTDRDASNDEAADRTRVTLPIRIDWSALGPQAERVFSALTELSQRLPELGPRLVGAMDADDEIFALEIDTPSASGASELVVRLEPGDTLRRLLAASGARDADLHLIEEAFRHHTTPMVVVDSSTIGPAGGGGDLPVSAGPGDTEQRRGEAVLQAELIPDGVALDEEGGAWLKWLAGSRTFGSGPRRYNLGAASPGKVTTGHLSAILEAARRGPVLVVGSALIKSWHRSAHIEPRAPVAGVGDASDDHDDIATALEGEGALPAEVVPHDTRRNVDEAIGLDEVSRAVSPHRELVGDVFDHTGARGEPAPAHPLSENLHLNPPSLDVSTSTIGQVGGARDERASPDGLRETAP